MRLLRQLVEKGRKNWMYVYSMLWDYAGPDDRAFPSVGRLARDCGMAERDVRAALRWLVAEGWVLRTERAGRTALYRIRAVLQVAGDDSDLGLTPPPARPGVEHPLPDGPTPPPKRPVPRAVWEGGTPPPDGPPNKRVNPREQPEDQFSINKNTPLSSSLRSEEPSPLTGGHPTPKPGSGSVDVQGLEQTPPPSIHPHASPEASSSARKAPQAPIGATDTSAPPRGPSKARTAQTKAAATLPAFAEPVRPQLEAWWRLRKQRHGAKAGDQLQARSVNALAFASERGVLEAFADLAAESGWISLGFAGYRDVVDRLAAEQITNDCNSRPNFGMNAGQHGRGFHARATTRSSEAADRAIALFASFETSPCSTPPTSSTSLLA